MEEEKVFFLVAIKEKIRQAAESGENSLFFFDLDGVERVFFVRKYGSQWVENANYDDIIRVSPS